MPLGSIVTDEWYTRLVDHLNQIGFQGAVDYYGYVSRDLLPNIDLLLNLGSSDLRFLSQHSGFGYFTYQVTVDGKEVLKDGDCITIGDIGSGAKSDITDAVVDAHKPHLLGSIFNQGVADFVDVFGADLDVQYTGKVRFKVTANKAGHPYAKWHPTGEASAIIAELNMGVEVKGGSWMEEDFTVRVGDKINARFSPAATITLFLYSIPES